MGFNLKRCDPVIVSHSTGQAAPHIRLLEFLEMAKGCKSYDEAAKELVISESEACLKKVETEKFVKCYVLSTVLKTLKFHTGKSVNFWFSCKVRSIDQLRGLKSPGVSRQLFRYPGATVFKPSGMELESPTGEVKP